MEGVFIGMFVSDFIALVTYHLWFKAKSKRLVTTREGCALSIVTASNLLHTSNLAVEDKKKYALYDLSESGQDGDFLIHLFLHIISFAVGYGVWQLLTPIGETKAGLVGVAIAATGCLASIYLLKSSSVMNEAKSEIAPLLFKKPVDKGQPPLYLNNPFHEKDSGGFIRFYSYNLPHGVSLVSMDSHAVEQENIENDRQPLHIQEMQTVAMDEELPSELRLRAKRIVDEFNQNKIEHNREVKIQEAMLKIQTVEQHYDVAQK